MIGFQKNDGGRRKDYGPGRGRKMPKQGDCVIRAISTATGQGYRQTLTGLCSLAIEMGGVPNGERVYERYLRDLGWEKHKPLRHANGSKVRLKDWDQAAIKRFGGGAHLKTFIVLTTSHLTVVSGQTPANLRSNAGLPHLPGFTLHDSWDCRAWCGNSFWTKEMSK
jgi:hypothetical protein